MKFDLAYCLSLDDKLSIYDVRERHVEGCPYVSLKTDTGVGPGGGRCGIG
jgi:hypothetical protein